MFYVYRDQINKKIMRNKLIPFKFYRDSIYILPKK